MEQHLNIESEEAVRLVAEISELTPATRADIVVRALREHLDKLREMAPPAKRTEEDKQRMIAEARAITADIRAHLTGPVSSDHSWLYGEDGLPG